MDIKIQKKRWNKFRNFLKFNKPKIIIFIVFLILAIIFQGWSFKIKCLKLFCEPLFFGILYYVIWPFDLLLALISINIGTGGIMIRIVQILFLFLQVAYWYIMSCLIAIPSNKIRAKIGKRKWKKQKYQDKILKTKIQKDIKNSEKLEIKKN